MCDGPTSWGSEGFADTDSGGFIKFGQWWHFDANIEIDELWLLFLLLLILSSDF